MLVAVSFLIYVSRSYYECVKIVVVMIGVVSKLLLLLMAMLLLLLLMALLLFMMSMLLLMLLLLYRGALAAALAAAVLGGSNLSRKNVCFGATVGISHSPRAELHLRPIFSILRHPKVLQKNILYTYFVYHHTYC